MRQLNPKATSRTSGLCVVMLHRKNALFCRMVNGAQVGDLVMTLLGQTEIKHQTGTPRLLPESFYWFAAGTNQQCTVRKGLCR
jgi:hypothetical protein